MPKITQEEMFKDLDYKCERCQAECTKLNAGEPEVGYLSKVDGEFTKLCQKCFNELPDDEKRMKTIPAAAFLVVVRNDGEGVYMTTEEVGVKYMREPTPYDVISACETIVEDVKSALTNQKLIARMVPVLQQIMKPSKLIIPK